MKFIKNCIQVRKSKKMLYMKMEMKLNLNLNHLKQNTIFSLYFLRTREHESSYCFPSTYFLFLQYFNFLSFLYFIKTRELGIRVNNMTFSYKSVTTCNNNVLYKVSYTIHYNACEIVEVLINAMLHCILLILSRVCK